jgi:hypothetical protein
MRFDQDIPAIGNKNTRDCKDINYGMDNRRERNSEISNILWIFISVHIYV